MKMMRRHSAGGKVDKSCVRQVVQIRNQVIG
jgi:hypothetical protein